MLQLRQMGAQVEFDGNDLEFCGVDRLHGAELSSYNDHRILMALAVAGSDRHGRDRALLPARLPDLLSGVRRPHERARDPGRRHAAGPDRGAGVTESIAVGRGPRPPTGRCSRTSIAAPRSEPDGRAVVCVDSDGADHALTWAELVAGSHAVAAELSALGVTPGEPVAYQLPNRLEFLTISLGALRIGAACMPLMPIFRERELGADGWGTAEIMRVAGVSKTAVWRWQERFMTHGVAGLLRDKTRPSRIPPLEAQTVARVVAATQADPPGEATHWTAVAMAKIQGISVSSVQHIGARTVCSRIGPVCSKCPTIRSSPASCARSSGST